MFRYYLVLAYHSLRYFRAKKRKKTLRLKIGDFRKFTSELDKTNIPIIVLRWWELIPGKDSNNYNDDVDCLINENNIWPIIKLAAKYPGKTKVDLYGICGRNGTSYNGMPYYPPHLAQKIYNSRVWLNDVLIPSDKLYKYSFIYHIVYHKGLISGVDYSDKNKNKNNKYLLELSKFKSLGLLPGDLQISLLNLHKYLKNRHWSMPLDLMSRWNENKEIIDKLALIEENNLFDIVCSIKGLTIFIIRSDAYIDNSISMIRSIVEQKFTILSEEILTEQQSNTVMNNTRGGNWIEKGKDLPTTPREIWICKSLSITPAITKKMMKKYPLVDNFEVLIKRDIRKEINNLDDIKRVVLHASDNDLESAIVFHSVYGDQTQEKIKSLQLML